MILPTKHIPLYRSLLGLGAVVLQTLNRPTTVTGLWERCRGIEEFGTFERFVQALDLLFLLGAVRLERGLLVRSS